MLKIEVSFYNFGLESEKERKVEEEEEYFLFQLSHFFTKKMMQNPHYELKDFQKIQM